MQCTTLLKFVFHGAKTNILICVWLTIIFNTEEDEERVGLWSEENTLEVEGTSKLVIPFSMVPGDRGRGSRA